MQDLEWLYDVWTDTHTATIRVGINSTPTVHFFIDDVYRGFVTARHHTHGDDAATAIAELGVWPASMRATSIVITWDEAHLLTSLIGPGDHPHAFVTVAATLDHHVLTWRPYQPVFGAEHPTTGLPTCEPEWGAPSTHPDAELPEPIRTALNTWRTLDGPPPVQHAYKTLTRAGHTIRAIPQSA